MAGVQSEGINKSCPEGSSITTDVLSNRLGSVSVHGVARFRGHPGLEYFLPHPGHGHLKAAVVIHL